MSRRIRQERKALEKMISMYCRAKHQPKAGLCPACQSLLAYAQQRLEKCFFGGEKPVCAKCPIHCYARQRRQEIAAVMRYAGPRLVFRDPWAALLHLMHTLYPAPKLCKISRRQDAGE